MTTDQTKRKGLKITKRERSTDSKGHFIANADVLAAFRESKKQGKIDRKSTRLNSSHLKLSRMPSSA